MVAFTFTSEADLPGAEAARATFLAAAATLVQHHCKARAWIVRHAPDCRPFVRSAAPWLPHHLATSFPRGRRLSGSPAALGIAETILRAIRPAACPLSTGSGPAALVAIKLDADMILSPLALAWLACSSPTEARFLPIGRRRWTGCWSVHWAHLLRALPVLRTYRCGGCPESSLIHAALRASGATHAANSFLGTAHIHRPGLPIPVPEPAVITLPTTNDPARRAALLRSLHHLP